MSNEYLNRTIKIEFIPDKEAEIMLRKNCEYRHFLYNFAVSLIKQDQDNDPDGYIGKIPKYELIKTIRTYFEKPFSVRPEWMEEYDYYFRGISECVVDDIYSTIGKIIFERLNGNSSDIRFMKYDPNNLSFRFKNKIHKERKPKSNGMYHGNSIVLTDNPYIIGLKINNTYGYPMGLTLRESINKFNIDLNEVREIAIKYHNEKWYLLLFIRDYNNYSDLIDIHYKRKKVAGIDLGEENPVVMYDGKEVKIPKHLQYPKDKIQKIENRIRRLHKVLTKKYNHDLKEAGLPQSNNYYKVLAKSHKAWEHLVNIKKDWHFKLAHWIVTHYKNIVVDEFHDYIIELRSNIIKKARQIMNKAMSNKSMYDFTQRLIHMSHKYGTNYFKVIKESIETTNTCNVCGNVNEIKLGYVNYKREKNI